MIILSRSLHPYARPITCNEERMSKTAQKAAGAAPGTEVAVSPKKPRKASQTAARTGVDIDAVHLPAKQRPHGKYTPEVAAEICDRLSNGEPLRQICRSDPKFPVWQKIYEWMVRDPALAGAIARAREVGQDAIAEEVYALVERDPERIMSEGGGRVDAGYVQWIRVQADIKLKLLAKWNPKRYGDRVALTGADGAPPIKVDHGIFDALLTNIELKRQIAD
jgi:hypothetical protein